MHRQDSPRDRTTPRRTRLAAAATAAIATVGIGATMLTAGTATAAGTSGSGSTTTPAHHKGTKGGGAASHNVALPANPTLQQIQAAAKTDIANRITSLQQEMAKVQSDKYLGGDKPTVLASLQGDIPGLTQLGQKIAADTDLATAKIDYANIFSTYRVYLLEIPRARLIEADDRILNGAGPKLTKEAAKIKSKETPANQAQVQPLLTDLATQVTNANNAVKSEVPRLEGYTPAAYDANHDLLKGDVAATKGAAGDLKKAQSDAKQARGIVGLGTGHGKKANKGTGSGTTPAPSTTAPTTPAPSTSSAA